MQGIAVIDKDLRNLDVEMSRKMVAVREPALGLLGQAIDQDHRHAALVGMQQPRQVKPFADVWGHDSPSLREDQGRSRSGFVAPSRSSRRPERQDRARSPPRSYHDSGSWPTSRS